jgi:hypothetical protein
MFLIDSLLMAPGKAVFFLLQELAKKAQEEWLDDDSVKIELQQIYALLEAGAISETEFETREYRLVERLQQIARAKLQEHWQGTGAALPLPEALSTLQDSMSEAALEVRSESLPEAVAEPSAFEWPESPLEVRPVAPPPLVDVFSALLAGERSAGPSRSPLLGMIRSLLPATEPEIVAAGAVPPSGSVAQAAHETGPAFLPAEVARAAAPPVWQAGPSSGWPQPSAPSDAAPAFQAASLSPSLVGVAPAAQPTAVFSHAASAAFEPAAWPASAPPTGFPADDRIPAGQPYAGNAPIRGIDRLPVAASNGLTMNEVIDCAIRGLAGLRMKVSSVTSVARDDAGWHVTAELVERKSVPDTSDLLGVYDLRLDDAGNVLRYERTRMRRRCDLGR